MSTIADQAINRAVANGLTIIDRYGHEVTTGYVIEAPAPAGMEWTTADATGTATVARLLGELIRPGQVLIVERLDPSTLIAEHCQHVTTAREAHHLSRLRNAELIHNVRTGKMEEVAATAWIVRTPATATAQQLLGASSWSYLADPVGTPRPGETLQTGTAHAYHTRQAAERAIKAAQQRGREHAEHAEAVEVNA